MIGDRQAIFESGIWKLEQEFLPSKNQRQKPQKPELMCACTGQKCEGICRTIHLHRERYANPVKQKAKDQNPAIRTSWTNPPNTCPESYAKDQKPKHYRA